RFAQRLLEFTHWRLHALRGGVEVGLDALEFELALEFGAYRFPLVARAAQEGAGQARGLRQALGPEHEQRHHADDEELAEADVEHRRLRPRGASVLLGV